MRAYPSRGDLPAAPAPIRPPAHYTPRPAETRQWSTGGPRPLAGQWSLAQARATKDACEDCNPWAARGGGLPAGELLFRAALLAGMGGLLGTALLLALLGGM